MNTVGSLFSGIGGLELGLERTGGFKTIWQCENDAYASAVLRKHWPAVPNLGDITKVNWQDVEQPDLICGGFPCQDISNAGKKAGIKEGTRSGLWFEFHKTLRLLQPRIVLIENVAALANDGLGIVLAGLAESGYDAEWFTLSAASVGAPHKRERLFIIAYADRCRCNSRLSIETERQVRETEERALSQVQPKGSEFKRGVSARAFFAYSFGAGFQRHVAQKVRRFAEFAPFYGSRSVEELRARRDLPQPLLGGKIYGLSRGVDRIKCLGNAVVPQVAQVIGEALKELENKEASKQ